MNPKEDLQTIREIMERSSKFLSLSGLSGVFAGIVAFIGAMAAWFFILEPKNFSYSEFITSGKIEAASGTGIMLAADAILVLIFAVSGAWFFSLRKAKKAGELFWSISTRRLLIHLTIPLITGGVFIIVLTIKGNIELIIPAMLIFYGLSLVNAGKFTLGEIHYLGLTQIFLGLLSCIFIEWGLLFWALGFGLMHIIYGMVMYHRHER